MTNPQENNKRIAKNTLLLYLRQLLILLVSLYTVRATLKALGTEDYGLNDLVSGTVTVLSFVSGTLTSATQRFFSFELGRKKQERLRSIFSVNLILYTGVAFLLLLLLETIGLWLVNNRLTIPSTRFDAVVVNFHFAVLSFFFTVLRTPFIAIIIAHEDMHLFAGISIVEVFLKLGAVIILQFVILPTDKLILYGGLICLVSVIIAAAYITICSVKYEECQYRKLYWNGSVARHLLGFTGWTLFGQISTVFRTQAVTIIVNQYFSPVILASQSIAKNVSGAVNSFAANFNTSLYPPIIKYYASEELHQMYNLVYNGSKICFFLLWVLALPLMLEMEVVLSLWLGEVPPFLVLFANLSIIEALIQAFSLPLTTAARAPGKMRMYELSLGVVQISIFVATLIAFHYGASAYSMYVVAIAANVVLFFLRLYIVEKLTGLPLVRFLEKVMVPSLIVVALSASLSIMVQMILPLGLLDAIIVIISSLVINGLCIYFVGLDKEWREKIKLGVYHKFRKVTS